MQEHRAENRRIEKISKVKTRKLENLKNRKIETSKNQTDMDERRAAPCPSDTAGGPEFVAESVESNSPNDANYNAGSEGMTTPMLESSLDKKPQAQFRESCSKPLASSRFTSMTASIR